MTLGIVLVSIWMALSLGFTWLILGLASFSECQEYPCRYDKWWWVLMLSYPVVIGATIVLWARPRTRAWGLVVGFVGTSVPAIVFTIVWGVFSAP